MSPRAESKNKFSLTFKSKVILTWLITLLLLVSVQVLQTGGWILAYFGLAGLSLVLFCSWSISFPKSLMDLIGQTVPSFLFKHAPDVQTTGGR